MIEEIKRLIDALMETNRNVVEKENRGERANEYERGVAGTSHLTALILKDILEKYATE